MGREEISESDFEPKQFIRNLVPNKIELSQEIEGLDLKAHGFKTYSQVVIATIPQ